MKYEIFLSVVMPGYNEGKHIRENLGIVAEILQELVARYEIVFVDDGSQDETFAEAQKAAAQNPHIHVLTNGTNGGKGKALKLGTAEASGEYIMFLDSDLDLSPEGIDDFLRILFAEGADVVVGSKLHPESEIDYPLPRRAVSFGYYLFLRMLFRLKIRDTQTGMKLFRAEEIKSVMRLLVTERFAFDIEMLALLNRKGAEIVSAPVKLVYGRETRWGRIGVGDILNVFGDTLKIFGRIYIKRSYDAVLKAREIAQ